MPKISIIIPIYNAKEYIIRCVQSLMKQTYKDIEYIFVDDCSTDGSLEALEYTLTDFPERQGCVEVLQCKRNKGSATARNIGLDAATGDYITFVDSDDWLESDGIEKMMKHAVETGVDIVMADFLIEQDSKQIVSPQGIDNADAIRLMKDMMTGRLHGSNCNKIYRRSLIEKHGLRFINGADYTEDLSLNIKLLALTDKIEYLPIAYYHYCVNSSSMSRRRTSPDIARKKDLQKVRNIIDFSCFLQKRGIAKIVEYELNYCKLQAKMPFLSVVTRRSCLRWLALFPEANKVIMKHDHFPLSYKLELILLANGWIWLFCFIHKIKTSITIR